MLLFLSLQHQWLIEDEEFVSMVKSDVRSLIEGPNTTDELFYVQSALSDIFNLFNSAKLQLSKVKKSKSRYILVVLN